MSSPDQFSINTDESEMQNKLALLKEKYSFNIDETALQNGLTNIYTNDTINMIGNCIGYIRKIYACSSCGLLCCYNRKDKMCKWYRLATLQYIIDKSLENTKTGIDYIASLTDPVLTSCEYTWICIQYGDPFKHFFTNKEDDDNDFTFYDGIDLHNPPK